MLCFFSPALLWKVIHNGSDLLSGLTECQECVQLFRVTGVKYLWPGQSFNTPLHCVWPTHLVPSVVRCPPVANTPKVSLTLVQYVASHHSCTSSWTLNQPCRKRLLYFIVETGQNSIFLFDAPASSMPLGIKWLHTAADGVGRDRF